MQYFPLVQRLSASNGRGRGSRALVAIALAVVLGSTGASADDESEPTDAAYAADRIAALVAQLDSEDPEERDSAIHDLSRLGPEARPAIPRLIDLLSDGVFKVGTRPFTENVVIYDSARRCLIAIGAESAAPLASRFPDESDEVQSLAAHVARFIGPDARQMLTVIHERFERTEGIERSELLRALAAIDPTGELAVPVMLTALRSDQEYSVRESAALFLHRTAELPVYWDENAPASNWFDHDTLDPIAVADGLREALHDESGEVRAMAASALMEYPESAELSIPLLIELLDDTGDYSVEHSNHVGSVLPVPTAAGSALGAFPEFADTTLPILIDMSMVPSGAHLGFSQPIANLAPHCERPFDHLNRLLEGENAPLALLAVARLGDADNAALARISELMTNDAAVTLCCVDPARHPEALQVVKSAISGERDSEFGRMDVCYFVADVGANAAFAAPMLIDHVIEADDEYRLEYYVVGALAALGPEAAGAAPAIIDRLDSDYFMQEFYEQGLTSLGPAIVPSLVDALADESRSAAHRISCLHVLGSFGADASDAISAILPYLESDYPRVRQAAVQALGQIALRPAESLPALQRAMSDPRPLVRANAARGIAAFRQDAEHFIPQVVVLLGDDYLDVQTAAADALRQFGPSACAAVPQLEELSQSDNSLLRETAIGALQKIRPAN